ncbi:MAG TPA: hypothetical protein PLN31_17305 [Azoarcus taiwanensis]|nr:hypothetical protein [Azoarcus taiwanensis]
MFDDADAAIEAQQRIIEHDGPLEVHLLSLNSLRNEQRKIRAEIAEIMRQREFEFVDFALDGSRYAKHRANAQHLGAFLHAMQKLYAHIKHGKLVRNAPQRISPALLNRCQLDVEAFFPSSFGVRFVAYTETDLDDGYSATNEALEATFDLVSADNPLEVVDRVTPWAMRQYRNLVATLIKADATPKVYWTTPAGDERKWSLDNNALMTLHNRLATLHHEPTRTLEAEGVLSGANTRRRRFELSGATLITGTAPKELELKITAYFNKPCRIVYSETIFIDDSTEQEKRVRTLLDITPVAQTPNK